MTDTPEDKNPHPDITFDDDTTDAAPQAETPKPAPSIKAPSKPAAVTPPPKPVPVAPAKSAAKPVTIAPAPAKKAPTPAAKPTAKVNEQQAKSEKVSVAGLVIDGLAAAFAVTFAILILNDVLPFLK